MFWIDDGRYNIASESRANLVKQVFIDFSFFFIFMIPDF